MKNTLMMPLFRELAWGETSHWTVLLVDDEPDNRVIAEKVLGFGGAKVYTAVHGAEALTKLETISPSFILLDLSMPVMDGWEMIKVIRENERTASLPVIALTAHAMAGDREQVIEAGFDGYIAKPFRLGTFISDIKNCFRELMTAEEGQAI